MSESKRRKPETVANSQTLKSTPETISKPQKLLVEIRNDEGITDYKAYLLHRIGFSVDFKVDVLHKRKNSLDLIVEFPSKNSSRRVSEILERSNKGNKTKIWCYVYNLSSASVTADTESKSNTVKTETKEKEVLVTDNKTFDKNKTSRVNEENKTDFTSNLTKEEITENDQKSKDITAKHIQTSQKAISLSEDKPKVVINPNEQKAQDVPKSIEAVVHNEPMSKEPKTQSIVPKSKVIVKNTAKSKEVIAQNVAKSKDVSSKKEPKLKEVYTRNVVTKSKEVIAENVAKSRDVSHKKEPSKKSKEGNTQHLVPKSKEIIAHYVAKSEDISSQKEPKSKEVNPQNVAKSKEIRALTVTKSKEVHIQNVAKSNDVSSQKDPKSREVNSRNVVPKSKEVVTQNLSKFEEVVAQNEDRSKEIIPQNVLILKPKEVLHQITEKSEAQNEPKSQAICLNETKSKDIKGQNEANPKREVDRNLSNTKECFPHGLPESMTSLCKENESAIKETEIDNQTTDEIKTKSQKANTPNQTGSMKQKLKIKIFDSSADVDYRDILQEQLGSLRFTVVTIIVTSSYVELTVEFPSKTAYRKAIPKLMFGYNSSGLKIICDDFDNSTLISRNKPLPPRLQVNKSVKMEKENTKGHDSKEISIQASEICQINETLEHPDEAKTHHNLETSQARRTHCKLEKNGKTEDYDKEIPNKLAEQTMKMLNTVGDLVKLRSKPQIVEIEVYDYKVSADMKKYLSRRMQFMEAFTIKGTEEVEGVVFLSAEFPSVHSAKRAMNLLQESNTKFNIKVKCYIDKERKLETQRSLRNARLSALASNLADRGRDLLNAHKKEIDEIEKRLQEIGGNDGKKKKKKFQSVDDFEKTKAAKDALNSKKEELENQRSEFKSFIQDFHDKLEQMKCRTFSDIELKEQETSFKTECTRFSQRLPIYARRRDIIYTIENNQTCIILGETGSGKSTQVVQYLHQTENFSHGTIVCTQPRKVAAISLATRVAQEMSSNVGHLVGYQVGLNVKKSRDTKIMYMTDHVLLNECLRDPTLSSFTCIIIDEAHERSIFTDLLLGMIKNCLPHRPDLKVVVTSATIDPEVFVKYFGGSPVLKVSGRTFPVDIVWSEETFDDNYEARTLAKAIEVHKTEPIGDVLVFLTSPLEVEKCCKAFEDRLRSQGYNDFVCLPLHGKLQAHDQQRVFKDTPRGKRKVVFATNSAETSITISGIKYVIDSGKIKEMTFDPKKNISSLVVNLVTKSSANQRSGRAGRTASGKCFRLYSEEEYKSMNNCSIPEILRVNLGQAILKLLELNVDPISFDFVESPPRGQLTSAIETLESIGATQDGKLTDVGRWIAKLPFDPIFGVFVHEALDKNVCLEALILTACCGSGSSLFYRSGTFEQKQNSDKMKIRFSHHGGDCLTMLNAFREWHKQPENKKGKWCAENYVNGKTIKAIRETVTEVIEIFQKELQIRLHFELSEPETVDLVLQKMIFKMFKHNICQYLGHEKAGYHVINKAHDVVLFPSSSIPSLGLQPEWVVIEQILQINRDYGVNATPVPIEWIDEGLKEGWLKPLGVDKAEQQKVKCLTTFGVGSNTFRDFVGPKYTKLKSLEQDLHELVEGKVIIDTDCKKGEIAIYSSPLLSEMLIGYIKGLLDPIQQKYVQEKSEQYLSDLNRGTRVVVDAGGDIDDVLMPDEYKTVILFSNVDSARWEDGEVDEDEVLNVLELCGEIEHFERFQTTTGRTWGKATFATTRQAEIAVESTRNELVNARPTGNVRLQNEHRFKAKLEWCRRPSLGYGYIELCDSQIREFILNDFSTLDIGGTKAYLQSFKKDPHTIKVLNLNKFVNEAVLRHSFLTKFNLHEDHVVRATVVRERVVTSRLQFNTIEHRLRTIVEQRVSEGKYDLHMKPPKEKDFTFLAFASFSKIEEGQNACSFIQQNFRPNDEIVTASIILQSSILIPRAVFEHCRDDVLSRIQFLNEEPTVNIRYKILRNGNCSIDMSCDHIDSLHEVRRELDALIQGTKMTKQDYPNINELFTRSGRYELKTLMANTNTLIIDDYRILEISIYGKKENQKKALEILKEHLLNMLKGVSRFMSVRGPDKPFGIFKELFTRYDIDLGKLRRNIKGLYCIQVDLRTHSVNFTGKVEALDEVVKEVNEVIDQLRERQGQTLCEDEAHQCAICFMEIDDGEMYRLEACGHPFCKACIVPQFESAVGNTDFPLVCCTENCNRKWAWHDLVNVSLQSGMAVKDLVNRATSSYISKHGEEYKYCTTPDCPTIYRITKNMEEFCCCECGARICTACHSQFHDGIKCDAMKELRDDSSEINKWLRKDPQNRKLCPSCNLPIEKSAGCNHMECTMCRHHFCWLCLKYYKTSGECYGHLREEHGGYGGGY